MEIVGESFMIPKEDLKLYQEFNCYQSERKQNISFESNNPDPMDIHRVLFLHTDQSLEETGWDPQIIQEIREKNKKKLYHSKSVSDQELFSSLPHQTWIYTVIIPEETENQPRLPSGFFANLRNKLPLGTYDLQMSNKQPTDIDYLSWALAGYDYQFSKSTWTPVDPLPNLVLKDKQKKAEIELLAYVTNLFRDSIRTRTNQFTPNVGYAVMRDLATKYGAKIEVIYDENLKEDFLAVYEVGKGSKDRPNVTLLTWSHENPILTIDLVGKGVCFDTGGNNLKTAPDGMYGDKGGALSQLALAELIMGMNLPVKLRLGVAWVVNSPGGEATNTHDIYKIGDYTVENKNTDAEGRLVMAPILAFFGKNNPAEFTITQATLTGAARVGFGHTGVLFAPNSVGDSVMAAMNKVADPVWRGPRDTRHLKDLKNSVADFGNMGGSFGGASIGDMFLCQFASKTTTFMHLDIAAALSTGSGITPKVTSEDLLATRGMYQYFKDVIEQRQAASQGQ